MTASTAVSSASSAATSASSDPLSSLSGNFSDFLKLLMTQLQNQDPTSPMDTNTFTQQLVQFTQVEQQINTNSNLTSLIQLTQGNALLQSSSLVGKTVEVQSNTLSLQNGTAGIRFASGAPSTVNVSVSNSSGVDIYDATVNTSANNGSWTWNGRDNNGVQLPDGAYTVKATDATGSGQSVSLDVTGVATGLTKSGNGLTVQVGSVPFDLSKVQSVGN